MSWCCTPGTRSNRNIRRLRIKCTFEIQVCDSGRQYLVQNVYRHIIWMVRVSTSHRHWDNTWYLDYLPVPVFASYNLYFTYTCTCSVVDSQWFAYRYTYTHHIERASDLVFLFVCFYIIIPVILFSCALVYADDPELHYRYGLTSTGIRYQG